MSSSHLCQDQGIRLRTRHCFPRSTLWDIVKGQIFLSSRAPENEKNHTKQAPLGIIFLTKFLLFFPKELKSLDWL